MIREEKFLVRPTNSTVQIVSDYLYMSWSQSGRNSRGELVFGSHPFSKTRISLASWHRPDQGPALPDTSRPYSGRASNEAYAQAYARMRGKLYAGSASLGVTLGSGKQSAEMIRKRADTLRTESSQLLVDALSSKRKGKDASGLILETAFGWTPLYQDIHAAATSLCQRADERESVTGYGKADFSENWVSNPSATLRQNFIQTGYCSCKLAAMVEVNNPNAWLAERAGLLNYAAVAWDLVPWSFMVNAFSNTGSIVNSLTDFTGLRFWGATITRKTYTDYTHKSLNPRTGRQSVARWTDFRQSRNMTSSFPTPSLVVRVPELNLETAVIGLSLVVQNLSKLNPLYRYGQKTYRELKRTLKNPGSYTE